MTYAVESLISGQSLSVPPPGLTVESDIQPWNDLNIEQPPIFRNTLNTCYCYISNQTYTAAVVQVHIC